MGRKEYLEKEGKSEKGQMKKRLWEWGRALERCLWKEEELEKLEGIYAMQKKMWLGDRSERGKRTMETMEQEYKENLQRLRGELEEILREKEKIDALLKRMDWEEEVFLRMRFEKGYGIDYIAIKMHMGRATVFRLQNRALEKLIEAEKEG